MQPAADGLQGILAASLRRAPAGEGPVLAWPLACGNRVAERTRALRFADGILHVQVPDAGWRRELQGLAAQYLAIVNRYSAERVERIEFQIAAK